MTSVYIFSAYGVSLFSLFGFLGWAYLKWKKARQ
jgi:hypothetical protein